MGSMRFASNVWPSGYRSRAADDEISGYGPRVISIRQTKTTVLLGFVGLTKISLDSIGRLVDAREEDQRVGPLCLHCRYLRIDNCEGSFEPRRKKSSTESSNPGARQILSAHPAPHWRTHPFPQRENHHVVTGFVPL